MDDEPPPDCAYCGKDISSDNWASDWHDDNRYEILICACGKKNWKPAIDGSGHGVISSRLESIIRTVCETSCNR